MTAFLFWNIKGQPLQAAIANLASRHEVDVLMLAECKIESSVLLRFLNRDRTQFHYIHSMSNRVQFYTRFDARFIPPSYDENGGRLTIRHLRLPGLTDVLLAACHLPSKLYWSDASQTGLCPVLSATIRNREEKVGHRRTVLVGDLNMNPFEDGVVQATGLHAVMCRAIAEKSERTVQRDNYPFFYNPMWSLLGDATPGPPGTYYRWGSELREFFWNMFDQVLIRPELLNRFRNERLKILHSDGSASLLTDSGVPDSKAASDHLPLYFELDL